MKRKTKQIGIAACILGIMFSCYHIVFSWFGGFVTMTDEEYARAAQELVDNSLLPCPTSTCMLKR